MKKKQTQETPGLRGGYNTSAKNTTAGEAANLKPRMSVIREPQVDRRRTLPLKAVLRSGHIRCGSSPCHRAARGGAL